MPPVVLYNLVSYLLDTFSILNLTSFWEIEEIESRTREY